MIMLPNICIGKKKEFEAEKWYSYKHEGVLGSESHKVL